MLHGDATAAWRQGLPLDEVPAGVPILLAGETSGRVLVLEDGAVEVLRDGIRIVEVAEPGAIFGELSLLLGRPHTADVRTTRPSTFRVAVATRFLEEGPGALYLAIALAQRLDRTNERLLDIQRRLEREQHPPGAIARMIESIGDSMRFGPPI